MSSLSARILPAQKVTLGMANHVGQQLGNYRLIRFLGQGSFANVYLGEHLYLKRLAALKVLRRSLQEKDVAQFLSEAQTLARLMHPHIVQIFEYAIEEGMPVLIMDYATGGTVRDCYPRASRLPPRTVAAYIKQVAAALQYAHNQNVIHRDVKPENLLLRSPKELVLSDFGLALLTPSPEFLSTQAMAGTVPYIAPEQVQGKPVFASDQYSLAIVAYEWLCGRRPFEGDQYHILYQHVSTPPPALREFAPDLPARIEGVVLKALAKDPKERFASVQSFAYTLERACQQSDSVDTYSSFETLPEYSVSEAQPRQKAYLVSAPSDAPFLARLQTDLEDRGVWLEHGTSEHTVTNALDEEEVRRQAMRTADIVLVLVSPSARSSRTLKGYLQIASMYERRLLFVWVAGEEITEVLPDSWGKAATIALIDARKSHYTSALDEIVAYIEEGPSITEHLPSDFTKILDEPRNPYKGLSAFTQEDAADFFGRETLIQELVETIQGILSSAPSGTLGTRLVTVMGPSGSGKSSMVMAGLLPRLQSGALPASEEWMYLGMVPGQHPVESLVLALAPHLPARSLKSLREDLEDDSLRGLHLLATQMMAKPDQKLVLLVDQFEEIFAQRVTEEEREHFIDLLVTAATEPQGSIMLMLTLRADFYDRLVPYPELGRLIQKHHHLIFPMPLQDLRAVIEHPAALPDVQLTFEGNLVGDLLFEMQGQAGALPLLQFTLDQLFQRRQGHLLTLQAYQEIGGVKGALAKQAESTYMSLPSEEHRRLARTLFLRLIDPGITEQDTTRRRATHPELVLSSPKESTLLQEAARCFIAARLLTAGTMKGLNTLEVSHEALIREWPRLSTWLYEAREDISFQQEVSKDAAEWERRSRPGERLYRGSQLKEARHWASRNLTSEHEARFLQVSALRQTHVRMVVLVLSLLVVLGIGLGAQLIREGAFLPSSTVVTTTADSGPGSLRQAIDTARGGSTITFDPSIYGKTILFTTQNLSIGKKLTLSGPGANKLAISSGHYGYHIDIAAGATVQLSGLTFKNSSIKEQNKSIITNEGTLQISDSLITKNTTAFYGGGIYNQGRLTLRNSIVSENMALHSGGGLYNTNHATLMLINSTVSGNIATNGGGGLSNITNSSLTLINTTVSNNTAVTLAGGGIANTFTSRLILINSTLSGNTASKSQGGGIYTYASNIEMTFCTIYGNKANGNKGQGGGMFLDGNPQPISDTQVSNSIIAGNQASSEADIGGDPSQVFTSDGYNLLQNVSGVQMMTHTLRGSDVLLDPHINPGVDPMLSGSSPQTLALLVGSPALGHIPLSACHPSGVTTDQRGKPRPGEHKSRCDIGAYEFTG